ncbi:MAG: hypothetical protein PHS62_04600 [Patescibacteria group bacterium]|nr:hypothetical protein [Patescibacteria group bacterium]
MKKNLKFCDLHTHSAHSREADNFLIDRLRSFQTHKRRMPGLSAVAITDHDTLNYLEPLYRAQKKFKPGALPLIMPGIEISSAFINPKNNKKISAHILGYFPDLIKKNDGKIKIINKVLAKPLNKILKAKLKKNIDIRLEYFFKNNIVPNIYSFKKIKIEAFKKYYEDIIFMEKNEPKRGDIINWQLNSSEKTIIELLLEKNIISIYEEGKLYCDRISDKKIAKLAKILSKKEKINLMEAKNKAKKLQGCCHGSANDDYYLIPTDEAIKLIIKAGGIPVFAHPMTSYKKFKGSIFEFFKFIKDNFIKAGLKGMEAYYPGQENLTSKIIEFCKINNLYITGGSDDHQDGRNFVGEVKCPKKYIEKFIKLT